AIMKGSVLRVPSREEIARIDASQAALQMQEQLARWQKQHASGDSEVPQAQEARATAMEQGKDDAATPSARGRLHVVAAGEDAATPATASLVDQVLAPTQQNIKRLQQQLAEVEEHNASLKSANIQLQQQASSLKQELL